MNTKRLMILTLALLSSCCMLLADIVFAIPRNEKEQLNRHRGHYPLYAHQNSVLMVDTWMCSALPKN